MNEHTIVHLSVQMEFDTYCESGNTHMIWCDSPIYKFMSSFIQFGYYRLAL